MTGALEQVEEHTTTVAGCTILGLSVYRARAPRMHGPGGLFAAAVDFSASSARSL